MKKRVHELAKELNIESKKIIRILSLLGIPVKSHMNVLDAEDIERLMLELRKEDLGERGPALVKSDDEAKENNLEKRLEQERKEPGGSQGSVARQTKELKVVQASKRLNFSESRLEQRVHEQSGLERSEGGLAPARDFAPAKSDKKALDDVKIQDNRMTRYSHFESGLVDRVPSRPPDKRFHEPFGLTGRSVVAGKSFGKSVKEGKTEIREQYFFSERGNRPYLGEKEQIKQQGGILKEKPPLSDRLSIQDKPDREVRDDRKAYEGKSKTKEQEKKLKKEVGSTGSKFLRTISPERKGDEKSRLFSSNLEEKSKFLERGKVHQQTRNYIEEKKHNEAEMILERVIGKAQFQLRKKTKVAPKPEENLLKLGSRIKKPIVIGQTVTVHELALKIQKKPAELIKKLMDLGVMATINQEIDADTAIILAGEFGYELEVKKDIDEEALLLQEPIDSPELLELRPPVVTVMGHVDHGKTSLLDVIRETNVTATEFGGITQHIGAYQVEHNGKKITFLDTPGHEAFTSMRARGAQVTDIAILVVAADDGVMPQTIEAINHAREASVPIVVAINKIDKPDADPERVKRQLTEYNLVSEEWGGDIIFVEISAKEKKGLDELLEMILLVAEMIELKANPKRPAQGTVIESELDKGRGPVANVLVQNGVLKVGDVIVAGTTFGRVRAMIDDKGRRVKKAGPSTPVEVLGFSYVPQAGNVFKVVTDEKLARLVAEKRQLKKREEELKTTVKASLDDLFKEVEEGRVKELRLIIKADTHGSVEALKQALERLSTEEVKINLIHTGIGAISETDIMLASASKAIVIGFNVRPDVNARKASEIEKIDLRLYRLIYEVIEDVRTAMSGLLEPEYKELVLGRVEVRRIFKVSRIGTIAGCYVNEGKISRDANVRLIRDGIVVYEGKLDSLKRFKDDVKEVEEGYECGLTLEKYNEIKEGDIIEVFITEAIKRELVSIQ